MVIIQKASVVATQIKPAITRKHPQAIKLSKQPVALLMLLPFHSAIRNPWSKSYNILHV
jgi:hypothetical protein